MGKTPANGIRNLDDIYSRLVEFIDSRLEKSNFLVVGSSCGAYIARAIAQKYSTQVDGLLLRVPLMEPNDKDRDLDPFESLVSNKQVMDNRSAKEKAAMGNDVLIQTPEYVKALMRKYETLNSPAIEEGDNDVLVNIREDQS